MAVIKTLFIPAKKQARKMIGFSDCAVDGVAVAEQLEETINPYLAQGYELFSITPIISGNWSAAASYGYSFTEGIVVVLKTNLKSV